MIEDVAANAPVGIRLQNLVSVGVRDTLVSLLLLIAILGFGGLCSIECARRPLLGGPPINS
jgi:hypothetical protein